jgi:flagellar motility protein MotE (MotC chaperone)
MMGKVYAASVEHQQDHTPSFPKKAEQNSHPVAPETDKKQLSTSTPHANKAHEGDTKETATIAKPTNDAVVMPPSAKESAPEEPLDITEFSASELKVLQSLRQRREELVTREATVGEKEKVLKGMEQRIHNKIEELDAIKTQIEAVRDDMLKLSLKFKENEDKQILSLVQVYEKMKPADAANIFNGLEMTVLLEVIKGMKEAKLAPVLASMDAQKATAITEALGRRTTLPPIAMGSTEGAPEQHQSGPDGPTAR